MRAIPDNNLAYPVLITLSNGFTGTGFYLNAPDFTFLVTAKHVIFKKDGSLIAPTASLLSYSGDPNDRVKNELSLDLQLLESSNNILPHQDQDIALLRVLQIIPRPGPINGVRINTLASSGLVGVPPDVIKKLDEVLVANEAVIFGYPTSIGLKQIPQLNYQRPLLRKGIVSSKDPDRGTIILDCPVYGGNSGGPVLELETVSMTAINCRIIGVVSQWIPYTEQWINTSTGIENLQVSNSGYSVAVGMDSVLELI